MSRDCRHLLWPHTSNEINRRITLFITAQNDTKNCCGLITNDYNTQSRSDILQTCGKTSFVPLGPLVFYTTKDHRAAACLLKTTTEGLYHRLGCILVLQLYIAYKFVYDLRPRQSPDPKHRRNNWKAVNLSVLLRMTSIDVRKKCKKTLGDRSNS